MPDRPEIVCLCGSTRFAEEMLVANRDLTFAGVIVVAPGVFTHLEPGEKITDRSAPRASALIHRLVSAWIPGVSRVASLRQAWPMAGSAQRLEVIAHVVNRIPPSDGHTCLRVAVDGSDGSGKTTFANELAAAVGCVGRPVVRVSLDNFHNVRAVRYQQGRESPEGFWRDSFNYQRFHSDVLEPFAPGGSRRYRTAAHDLATDAVLDPEPCTALPGTVLVVDGLFLHREELADAWDLSVFLDVPFNVTAKRMALRDGTVPDPEHPSMRRYVEAQRIYFNACAPHQRADIVVDNHDFSAPRTVRG